MSFELGDERGSGTEAERAGRMTPTNAHAAGWKETNRKVLLNGRQAQMRTVLFR